jgi:hypothetical protein
MGRIRRGWMMRLKRRRGGRDESITCKGSWFRQLPIIAASSGL